MSVGSGLHPEGREFETLRAHQRNQRHKRKAIRSLRDAGAIIDRAFEDLSGAERADSQAVFLRQ
jgi:hypothetical protein